MLGCIGNSVYRVYRVYRTVCIGCIENSVESMHTDVMVYREQCGEYA